MGLKRTRSLPELVAPAGDWASVRAAVESGADSVYFGVKTLNMRAMAANFDILEIKKVVQYCHAHKKKAYLTLNTVIKNSEIAKVRNILAEAKKAKVDAVILWDMAVLALAKKSGLPIHLSTQASVSNVEAITFFAKLGVKRMVLARECTLDDIRAIVKEIKKQKIRCAIETFIHGAMCVSISGRCFLSEYSFDKSANRGECLQPCRREFLIRDVDGESEYILGKDYVLSPKDLCTIDFIDELITAGISAFKIEGRMRSPEYIRTVVSVYRRALDAYSEGKLSARMKQEFKKELASVYTRGFSSGFYFGLPTEKDMSKALGHTHEKIYLGEVKKFYAKIGVADVRVQSGAFKKGDTLLFIGHSTPALQTQVNEMQVDHVFVDAAPKGAAVGVKLPFAVRPKDKVFLWKAKDL